MSKKKVLNNIDTGSLGRSGGSAMFKISKEMAEKEKTFEKLILQMRFCDLVSYRDDANRFFDEGIPVETALTLFENNESEIRQRTQDIEGMKDLWKDVSDDHVKAELTRAAFWKAIQIYIKLFGKIVMNSVDPSWAAKGIGKKSAMTIAEIRDKRDAEEREAHKRRRLAEYN